MNLRSFLLLGLLCAIPLAAAETEPLPRAILGDYDAELRTRDGHFDVAGNIAAFKKLGINTYFYLIWHSPTDWDDLPAFATAAEREGIQVWVYLIPWSEARKKHGPSKPFELDFIRWAQEIGKLSLDHPNIVGYAMDDFYVNGTQPDRFTKQYVQQMVDAGRKINPKIKFYTLTYFQQDWSDFMNRFGDCIDGVVAAYPQSRLEVEQVLKYLRGEVTGFSVMIDVPKGSKGGVSAFVSRDLPVRDPNQCAMSFYWDAGDHRGGEMGRRLGFVRVNGELAWSADANGEIRDSQATLDLSRYAREKNILHIELGAGDESAVTQYPVGVKFDDVRFAGFDIKAKVAPSKGWKPTATGGFTATVSDPPPPLRRTPLPLILMPNGESYEHTIRYGTEPSGKNIAQIVRLCLSMLSEGKVQGVVTYCLPKTPANEIFDAVTTEYQRR